MIKAIFQNSWKSNLSASFTTVHRGFYPVFIPSPSHVWPELYEENRSKVKHCNISQRQKLLTSSIAQSTTWRSSVRPRGGFHKDRRPERPRSVTTAELKRSMKESIVASPKTTIFKLTKDYDNTRRTVGNLLKAALGFMSLQLWKTQLLASIHCRKRREGCRERRNWLKNIPGKEMLFPGENNFTSNTTGTLVPIDAAWSHWTTMSGRKWKFMSKDVLLWWFLSRT